MNLNSKIVLGLRIVIILSKITINHAAAEMNFQDMKGVHDFFKPESEHLSPIYGLTLLGTKTLENMRFYGNYGPKRQGYSCLESASQIHDQLVKNHDCPQDKTTELIQRLFPSQDGANFVANQIDQDIASHLDPETLGKLASTLAEAKDEDLTDSSKVEALETELKDLLFQGLNPKGYYEQRRNAVRTQFKLLKQQGTKNPHSPQEGVCTDCHSTELTKIQQELEQLDSIIKKLRHGIDDTTSTIPSQSDDSNGPTPKKGRGPKGKDKDYKELAALLIGALKESRLEPRIYSRNLPEQVLLSYFWKKASHKEDFLPLLKGMSGHLKDPHTLNQPDSLKRFLAQKYSKEDFKSVNLKGDPKDLAFELVSHPEKLVFLAGQDKLEAKPLPPFLSYASAKHSSLDQGTYPDCGETSVRNFFNIALYDPSQGKFNSSFLEEYKKQNPQLNYHSGLTSFYHTHTDPAASVNQIARDDWSENVVSKHEGVNYLRPSQAPKCEINAGVDNMMNLVDRLLYQGSPGGSPISKASSRAARVDELCKTLSREGFKLDWELVGSQDKSKLNERDTGVELKFSINGKPSFIWEFMSGHFVVKNIGGVEDSWMSRIAPQIADQLHQSKVPGGHSRSPLLINWFATEKNWEELSQSKTHPASPEVQTQLFYSLPLGSNEVRLSAFEKVLSHGHTRLYRAAQRLQGKLPENDPQTQQRLEAALANADYPQPWGDPLHAAGGPELKYTRIPKASEVLTTLGVNHEKSFDTAWRDPRGLIWAGDVLKDDQGKEIQLDFQAAKDKCFNLNPAQSREKVKASYESIESNPELKGLRKTYFRDRNEENKNQLLKKYAELSRSQVPGCFSPSFEHGLLYTRDQGYLEQNGKFVPRFLKGVYRRWFWSGSGYYCDAGFALYFDGGKGEVANTARYYGNSVRCVCAEAG